LKTIIKNANLIDGLASEPTEGVNLLIDNGTIADIGPEVDCDKPGVSIDAGGKTVMPGLIDAHLHLMGIRGYNPVLVYTEPPFLRATRGVADVRKLIEAGFTAVRCAGSNLSVSLKKAVEEGMIPGPRIIASNLAISQTAGLFLRGSLTVRTIVAGPHASRSGKGPESSRS